MKWLKEEKFSFNSFGYSDHDNMSWFAITKAQKMEIFSKMFGCKSGKSENKEKAGTTSVSVDTPSIEEIFSVFAKKYAEKAELSAKEALEKLTLGGSARIQQELGVEVMRPWSDLDFFTSSEEEYEAVKKILYPLRAIREGQKGKTIKKGPYKGRVYYETYYYSPEGQFEVDGLTIDLSLVEKVLDLVEQIKLHINVHEDHARKIFATRFDGWEQVVYDLKMAEKLDKELREEYIIWLSDQGKI